MIRHTDLYRWACSTLLAGGGFSSGVSVDAEAKGDVVVSGVTSSEDFPLKNPAQTWPGATRNAFVANFSLTWEEPAQLPLARRL